MIVKVDLPARVGIAKITAARPRDEVSELTFGYYSTGGIPITDGVLRLTFHDLVTYVPKNPAAFEAREHAFQVWVDGVNVIGEQKYDMAKTEPQTYRDHIEVQFSSNPGEPYNTIVKFALQGVIT